MKQLAFYKMEGCGNSFVLVTHDDPKLNWSNLASKVCDVHFGVGSDGLLVVLPSDVADFEVRMFNPDGSAMGMCGNGSRCAAVYLRLNELIPSGRKNVSFVVWERIVHCEIHDNGCDVTVDLGAPVLEPEQVPVVAEKPIIDQKLFPEHADECGEFRGSVISMGNPHCVLFTERLNEIEIDRIGPLLENHKMFPKKANIEFVRLAAKDRLDVRVWERAAGVTLACGSAACAVVVAGCLSRICSERMKVGMPGGLLGVFWDRAKNTVFLTGPTKVICTGVLDSNLAANLLS